jgi:hypothetical protein
VYDHSVGQVLDRMDLHLGFTNQSIRALLAALTSFVDVQFQQLLQKMDDELALSRAANQLHMNTLDVLKDSNVELQSGNVIRISVRDTLKRYVDAYMPCFSSIPLLGAAVRTATRLLGTDFDPPDGFELV